MSPAASDLPDGGSADRLTALLGPVALAVGLDLEEVQVTTAGRRRRIRIVVDRDGGVDLDECAALSRQISDTLDATDVLGDRPYTLEVSSPGVSRPLTLPRHWRRNVGRLVTATLADQRQVTGRVREAHDTGVLLEGSKGDLALAYADILKAKIQVEFRKVTDANGAEG